jgi:integrase
MGRAKERLGVGQLNKKQPGFYADGGNLYLRVDKSEDGVLRRSWIFRYKLRGSDRERDMGLGPVGSVRLKRARELAADYRELVATGIDPIEHRRTTQAEKLKADPVPTFDQVAEKYITANRATWTNAKHAWQWGSSLAMYVSPVFGKVAVDQVDTAAVLRALEPHWSSRTETMKRVRARIEAVLGFATVRGWRQGDNPARWRHHLSAALARPSKIKPVEHHPALPYEQIGSFMAELRQRPGMGALALQFCLLTAARTGEVTGATWDEIDLKNKSWTVPANRIKSGREHRVPLSAEALSLLKQVKAITAGIPGVCNSKFIFPNDVTGEGLGGSTLLAVLKRMKRLDMTTHGLRASFRTWSAERTNFPRGLCEAALAHSVGDKTERSYQRGDLFEKRRKLMEQWASFCNQPSPAGEVVEFKPVDKKAAL